MSFWDTVKQMTTNEPINIKEPTFVKKFADKDEEINLLQNLASQAEPETAKQIEQDIKKIAAGISGEKNIAYELKNSRMPVLILHDLNLEYNGLTAQIDYIVIDMKFILVIECKKMTGDIEINNKGEFTRLFKNSYGKVYKKEGIYSPITQNQRHVELVKDIFSHEMDSMSKNSNVLYKSIIVIANPKTIVNDKYAPKEIKSQIIKYDQLINHMKALHADKSYLDWITEDGMHHMADLLIQFHHPAEIDYAKKYGIKTVATSKSVPVPVEKEESNTASIPEHSQLYEELRKYRWDLSKKENIKAYFIFNNVQLDEIIQAKPQTIDALMKLNGFGPAKCEKYGAGIIEIIKEHTEKR